MWVTLAKRELVTLCDARRRLSAWREKFAEHFGVTNATIFQIKAQRDAVSAMC